MLEPLVLAVALREVRPDRDAEREAPLVDLDASRCTAHAGRRRPYELGLLDPRAQLVESPLRVAGVGAEHLEVDDRAQPQLVAASAAAPEKL